MEVENKQESLPEMPPGPRDNLISTAAKFLQNPGVRNSPLTQRREFLIKKGLTNEEVEIALQRASVNQDVAAAAPNQQAQYSGGAIQYVTQKPSLWTIVKEYLSTAVVIGGIAYAAYHLYKYYIAPYFFGPSKEDKKLDTLEKSITELNSTVQMLLEGITNVKQSLNEQNENVKQVCTQQFSTRGSEDLNRIQEEQKFNDIKTEISSLKGLLLSRKQFPNAPKTNPVLPSWQLNSKENEISTITATELENSSQDNASVKADSTEEDCHQSNSIPSQSLEGGTSDENQSQNINANTCNGLLENNLDS